MNSLAFSVGPTKFNKICVPIFCNNMDDKESNLKLKSSNEEEKDPQGKRIWMKRREALLSVGLLVGIGEVVNSAIAAEPASSSSSSWCELRVAPSGLAFCDKHVGTGPQPVKGQLIKAHYVGKLENGKVFDSSYDRAKPLTFRVGVGEVIKGWDEGIIGGDGIPAMRPGGKRRLKVPPQLGYGVRGAGCKGGSCIVPPNSVLLFDVEFIGKA